MTPPSLRTTDLAVGYQNPRHSPLQVAAGVNAELRPGELVCLIGPNGAGKSTLLRTLAGMQKPLAGRVELLGHDIHRLSPPQRARYLAIVSTERPDIGLLSVYALVALGRHPYTGRLGYLTARDHAVVQRALEAVGAVALAERHFNTLSDGERQKALIARALAQEPEVMILDEPTAFLDLPRRIEILYLLRDLARRDGMSILLSTHDLDLALRSADQLWLLPGDGHLQTGLPEDLVLSGGLERAFATADVQFDLYNGSFEKHQPATQPVSLAGEGAPLRWTRRALRRVGYQITSSEQPAIPHIICRSNHWELRVHDRHHACQSLQELLNLLRSA